MALVDPSRSGVNMLLGLGLRGYVVPAAARLEPTLAESKEVTAARCPWRAAWVRTWAQWVDGYCRARSGWWIAMVRRGRNHLQEDAVGIACTLLSPETSSGWGWNLLRTLEATTGIPEESCMKEETRYSSTGSTAAGFEHAHLPSVLTLPTLLGFSTQSSFSSPRSKSYPESHRHKYTKK